MLLLTILTLSLLAFGNYLIGAKSILYPPFVFSAVWAADLALIWAVGDFFYPSFSNLSSTQREFHAPYRRSATRSLPKPMKEA